MIKDTNYELGVKRNRSSQDKYLQVKKMEKITAPPPPSIRVRTPEPPPLKRYIFIIKFDKL